MTFPLVDAVATHDAETGDTAVFLVNRSLDEEVEIVVDVRMLGDVALLSAESLHDDDIHAANTPGRPRAGRSEAQRSARLVDQ